MTFKDAVFWLAMAVLAILALPFLMVCDWFDKRRGAALAVLVFAGALSAQEYVAPPLGAICGDRTTTAQLHYVNVACVDFDAVRKFAPDFPATGQWTQVLIYAKYGDSVRVEAFYTDAEGKEASVVQWADLRRDAYANLAAMPQFSGINYHRYTVKVLRDAE